MTRVSRLCEGTAGLVGLSCLHSGCDSFMDGSDTLRLGGVRGDAVERGRAVSQGSVDIADACRRNRPSIGTGVCTTALLFICIGVVLFHSAVRVEHPNWRILSERTLWTEEGGRGRGATPQCDAARRRRAWSACVQGTRRRSGAACTGRRVSISRVHMRRAS